MRITLGVEISMESLFVLTRLVKKVNTLQRVASVGITSAGNRNKNVIYKEILATLCKVSTRDTINYSASAQSSSSEDEVSSAPSSSSSSRAKMSRTLNCRFPL